MTNPAGKHKKRNGSVGFTLIEILVVVALMGIVGTMVFETLAVSKNLFNKTAEKVEGFQQVRRAMALINRDIQNVARSQNNALRGADQQTYFEGAAVNNDSLSLNLFSKRPASVDADKSSVITIKYFVNYDEKQGHTTLNRGRELNNGQNTGISKALCDNVKGINFRYLKNGSWHSEWKSGNLPDAVEITILIDTKQLKSSPEKLQTVVSVIS